MITWQDEDIDIDHGKVNIHVTNLGFDVANAKVYLFTETGSYLGKYENTNEAGMASFTLPIKAYKFRVDYGGSQYWSGEVTPLPQEETDVDLALNILTLQLTNNPKPVRFDGVPMEHQPEGIMLASIGSLTGILTQSIVAQIPETKICYYINDHLGTPMKVIDENNTVVWSADYNPFGDADITVNTFENNFRFPGQYYDQESNLHYNLHRYYYPQIGRYLRADPIGLLGGINLYTYVSGNPINATDPSGQWVVPIIVHFGSKIAPYLIPLIPYIPAGMNIYDKYFSPWSPGIPEIIDGGKSFRENYNRWKKRRERKNICKTDTDQPEGFDPYELSGINEKAERLAADKIYKELRNEMENIRKK